VHTEVAGTASGPRFKVSPEILGPLGLEQLRDPGLAILELIKNSWDADAEEVVVEISTESPGRIIVSDDGTGMAQSDFENYWLVLGETHKRKEPRTKKDRPVIGEKGLGRLACFALGSEIAIASKREGFPAFAARISWDEIMRSTSLDATPIQIYPVDCTRGTTVTISTIKRTWSETDTELLTSHVEFLAAPRESDRFTVKLRVDDWQDSISVRPDLLDRFAEAELVVEIEEDGVPQVTKTSVEGESYTWIPARGFPARLRDSRLAGCRIKLLFFRRDVQLRKARDMLVRDQVKQLLERYEGVRVFRDGINVPPYGLEGNDWAKLEKQRTATGGPTMVPGNSQLIGEVHISREKQKHLTITAGRAGFTDQQAVSSIAENVRWAVKHIGTIRRAAYLGIKSGRVPSRVDEKRSSEVPENAIEEFKNLVEEVSKKTAALSTKRVKELIVKGRAALRQYDRELRTARIYAQLATTGASAASFAHEQRKQFDIVNDAIEDLGEIARNTPSFREDFALLQGAWANIRGFVALFKLVPVKTRRETQTLDRAELEKNLAILIAGIPHDTIEVIPEVSVETIRLVPAELDSIVINLYTNAVKAIRESDNRSAGQIGIRLYQQKSELVVDVLDNGCGVAREVAKLMWEPVEGIFPEGTGMGLPITSFLAELYDGEVVWIDRPELGFRTMFRARLRGVGIDEE